MPKMFIHSRAGTFTADARAEVAAALTDLGMSCERLTDTARVRAGVWVWFTEHPADAVFSGGRIATDPLIALVINAIDGGLDGPARQRLITEATAILRKHLPNAGERPPIYVVIHEVPEVDWGMCGAQVNLAAMRAAN